MDFQSDAQLFFADVGEDGLLGGEPVRGFFRSPLKVEGLGFTGMSANHPTFELPTAQVPDQPYGLELQLGDVVWTVADFQHDGTGVCTLLLSKT